MGPADRTDGLYGRRRLRFKTTRPKKNKKQMMGGRIRPRRSVLYVPGINGRAQEKARTLPADCIVLDLEDSVAPSAKGEAREMVMRAVQAGFGQREVVVRINGLDTAYAAADIAAAVASGADGILIPKVYSSDDIRRVRAAMSAAAAPEEMAIWAMIETPLAVLNAGPIAASADEEGAPLVAFMLGNNDLAREMRIPNTAGRGIMIPWIAQCLAAARAYGLDMIDGVFNRIGDDMAFRAECREARSFGLDGKSLIHPSQVVICNAAFTPTAEERAWAQKVMEAYALAENADKSAIAIDGQMVERLHLEMARRTLALAAAAMPSSAPALAGPAARKPG